MIAAPLSLGHAWAPRTGLERVEVTGQALRRRAAIRLDQGAARPGRRDLSRLQDAARELPEPSGPQLAARRAVRGRHSRRGCCGFASLAAHSFTLR